MVLQTVLLVVLLLVVIAMIIVILLQRTAQDGGGLMGGSSTMGGLFTARGSANFLTRTTAVLATIFIVISLVLAYLASGQLKGNNLADKAKSVIEESDKKLPELPAPSGNALPKLPSSAGDARALPEVPVAK